MAKIAVLLADGFEEIEAISVIDILRRAEQNVIIVGVTGSIVTSARGVKIIADELIANIKPSDLDMVILPGGKGGADNLNESQQVTNLIIQLNEEGKYIGAICAAPFVLAEKGLLTGKDATSYPSFKEKLSMANYKEDRTVVYENIITSKGPATAADFAFELLEKLTDKEKIEEIKKGMLY